MNDDQFNLDELIINHGEFLEKFGIRRDEVLTGYYERVKVTPAITPRVYFCELLNEASLYNSKNAKTEKEAYYSKLELDTKMLEYGGMFLQKDSRNYLIRQIHLDKLMISRLTLPFNFDVQINAANCCSYCSKKDKQIITFEKMLEKQYLPFWKCKKEGDCNCSYTIIPLNNENGLFDEKDE